MIRKLALKHTKHRSLKPKVLHEYEKAFENLNTNFGTSKALNSFQNIQLTKQLHHGSHPMAAIRCISDITKWMKKSHVSSIGGTKSASTLRTQAAGLVRFIESIYGINIRGDTNIKSIYNMNKSLSRDVLHPVSKQAQIFTEQNCK